MSVADEFRERINEIMSNPERDDIFVEKIDISPENIFYTINIGKYGLPVKVNITEEGLHGEEIITKRCKCCGNMWMVYEWKRIESFDGLDELYHELKTEETVKCGDK